MTKIGIILNNIGNNQQAYDCINYANTLFQNPDYDCVLFFEDLSQRIVHPQCAVMNISDIWKFDGNIIFTKIEQYGLVSKLLLKKKMIFYLYDIEWVDSSDYEKNYLALTDENIKLVCRSQYHSNAVEKYCGRKADAIIPDFNIKKML